MTCFNKSVAKPQSSVGEFSQSVKASGSVRWLNRPTICSSRNVMVDFLVRLSAVQAAQVDLRWQCSTWITEPR